MWESKENVYDIIKPPKKKNPSTPPRSIDTPNPMAVRNLLWTMKTKLKLREAATFGYLPGSQKPRTDKFLLKHSKEPQLVVKRTREGGGSTSDNRTARKPPLPNSKEHPKYGLKSDKNYITENAVMVIRAKPDKSRCPKKEEPFRAKPGFGTLPMYLVKRKEEAAKIAAKESPENQAECQHPGTRRLDDNEKQKMVNNLKVKWAQVNAEYQRLPFIADTDAAKSRQNRYEQELENLQKDVTLLSRKVIFVSEKSPPRVRPSLL